VPALRRAPGARSLSAVFYGRDGLMSGLAPMLEMAGVLAALVLGLALLLRRRSAPVLRVLGGAITVGVFALVVWSGFWISANNPVDLNPSGPASEIVGDWTCEGHSLRLSADGSFVRSTSPEWRGNWRRTDWNLDLRDSSGTAEYYRVIRVAGRLVLVKGWLGDGPRPPECRQR
jgi:hypothetical protein